ncbi:hypothetical protein [Acinetobacter baumannii]|uniref:hypothetical protein n=1 Tax=Acinetobacter baumannii TaxID=470 RepID=UPI001E0F737A|nr:hypothetical protein [Acinetobacter baumannii]MDC5507527.1 hypothetical protein [Acinetobacter baumannii]MDX7932487.1 hypothetical protein [Acinetobacter baumannii]
MLTYTSLLQKEFNQEELTLMKRLDLSNIPITMPENLAQILIWTSKLAQYHHALFIQSSQKLELITENDKNKKQELNDLIKLYRKTAFVENQTKDFYLNKLLNQGEVVVQGYIQHPSKKQTKYAIIPYHGYDFITLATPNIVAKFPLHYIEIKKESIPQALTDIHLDEEELLSTVKDFVKSFRKLYKECVSKNELIKEHNTIVHKIYVKIKNGEVKLIKQDIPIAVPKVMKTATTQPINKKSFKVIKKRKFPLLKDK